MNRKRRDPLKLLALRRMIQLVFLLILVLLLVGASSGRMTRTGAPLIIFATITVILSLILGRVWCSWACPVNTLLDRVHFNGAITRGGRIPDRWRLLKYPLLVVSIAAIYILVVVFKPGALAAPPSGALNPMVLIWAAIGLLIIVGLEYFAEHFFCRYLCPIGGAVGLLAKIAPMHRIVRSHCNDCSICVDACPVGTIDPHQGFASDPSECTVCLDCMTVCTSGSNGFSFRRHTTGRKKVVVPVPSLMEVQQ